MIPSSNDFYCGTGTVADTVVPLSTPVVMSSQPSTSARPSESAKAGWTACESSRTSSRIPSARGIARFVETRGKRRSLAIPGGDDLHGESARARAIRRHGIEQDVEHRAHAAHSIIRQPNISGQRVRDRHGFSHPHRDAEKIVIVEPRLCQAEE
jgi:hypothetical protein